MVEFGTSSAFRGWVRVRVLDYGSGVRDIKVKSRVSGPLRDVAAHFHVGRQQPRRALRARGCRSAAAGQTMSGKHNFPVPIS